MDKQIKKLKTATKGLVKKEDKLLAEDQKRDKVCALGKKEMHKKHK